MGIILNTKDVGSLTLGENVMISANLTIDGTLDISSKNPIENQAVAKKFKTIADNYIPLSGTSGIGSLSFEGSIDVGKENASLDLPGATTVGEASIAVGQEFTYNRFSSIAYVSPDDINSMSTGNPNTAYVLSDEGLLTKIVANRLNVDENSYVYWSPNHGYVWVFYDKDEIPSISSIAEDATVDQMNNVDLQYLSSHAGYNFPHRLTDSGTLISRLYGIKNLVLSYSSGKWALYRSGAIAYGDGSIAQGCGVAYGTNAVALNGGHAMAYQSFAHGGVNTAAYGAYSHAEGDGCTTMTTCSHAEGLRTTASGYAAHAEGEKSVTYGMAAHAEGYSTSALGYCSHAEGAETIAYSQHSHAEGFDSKTLENAYGSHAEGYHTVVGAGAQAAHAEGYATSAMANFAHAEGLNTTASGTVSHAEGCMTLAKSAFAHAEGGFQKWLRKDYNEETSSWNSYTAQFAGGYASGVGAHAEGIQTSAIGVASHAEGGNSNNSLYLSSFEIYPGGYAYGNASHAEGIQTSAIGVASHAEGISANASDDYSFAWNGSSVSAYSSNGPRTFNINPENGISGFYIGNRNLAQAIKDVVGNTLPLVGHEYDLDSYGTMRDLMTQLIQDLGGTIATH